MSKNMPVGKRFSSEYQPDKEIWTEQTALLLCNDLLEWLKETDEDGEDKGNIFFEEFIYMVADPKRYHKDAKIYAGLPSYLSEKFASCFNLLSHAKKIQEIKLYKYGTFDKLNAAMTKFCLINEHGKLSDNSKNMTEHSGEVKTSEKVSLTIDGKDITLK